MMNKTVNKGSPESADAVIARGSKVFVADKLSDIRANWIVWELNGLS